MNWIGKHPGQENFNLNVKFTDGTNVLLTGCEKDASRLADGYVQIIRGEEVHTFFTRNINYVLFEGEEKE